jgi:hypothetical protein
VSLGLPKKLVDLGGGDALANAGPLVPEKPSALLLLQPVANGTRRYGGRLPIVLQYYCIAKAIHSSGSDQLRLR